MLILKIAAGIVLGFVVLALLPQIIDPVAKTLRGVAILAVALVVLVAANFWPILYIIPAVAVVAYGLGGVVRFCRAFMQGLRGV